MNPRRAPVVLGPRQVGITIRGGVLLAAGITATVAAWRLGQPVIAGLGAAAAIAVLGALAWQYLSPVPRVDVEWDAELIDVGQPFTVHATVSRSRTPMDVVWPLIDERGNGLGRRSPEARGRVWQGNSAAFTRRVTPLRRGSYDAGPVAVVRWDPFAVTRGSFLLESSATIDVAPTIIPINARPLLPPTSSGPSHSGRAGDRAMHARTWQPGDQRRDVHWRATARTGTLMTYEHDAVSPDHIHVVVDSGDDALGDLRVSWGLSVAVSLQQAGWQAALGGVRDEADGDAPTEATSLAAFSTGRDALRRVAARLPRTTARRWPQSAHLPGQDARASVIAVVSADAPVPPAEGPSIAIIVGEDDAVVDAAVAAAQEAGWRAVGAVPDMPESALATALAALAVLGVNRR